ncbi:MAG: hypothetical protein JEY91_19380 [Spirochaetaceae bacterium]|nr:hypothetical protein [Spirochaetaceae bacterium]
MNKKIIVLCVVLLAMFPLLLTSQSAVKGSGVNGSTGVVVSPTARIGWEYSNFGLDFGYSFLYNGQMDHVPSINFSIRRKAEIGMAFNIHDDDNFNLLFHGKFQFFREAGSSLAMGLDGEFANLGNDSNFYLTPYIVTSFSGNFFTWPAVTSMMFGWHMIQAGSISSNFAFSMGFELALAPKVFKNYIFLISDFSNYSYSISSMIDAGRRGAFNTGLRIDPVKKGKFKFTIDLVGTDLLDSNRGFMASAVFGFGF